MAKLLIAVALIILCAGTVAAQNTPKVYLPLIGNGGLAMSATAWVKPTPSPVATPQIHEEK